MHTEDQYYSRMRCVSHTLAALTGKKVKSPTPSGQRISKEELIDSGIEFLNWVIKDLEQLAEISKIEADCLAKRIVRQKEDGKVNKHVTQVVFAPEAVKKAFGSCGYCWHQTFEEFKKTLRRVGPDTLRTFDWYTNYIEFKLFSEEGNFDAKQEVVRKIQKALENAKDTINQDEKECLIEIFSTLRDVIGNEPIAEVEVRRARTPRNPLDWLRPIGN